MRLRHGAPVARVSFDDPNLVSCAGLVPVMRLAQDVGLHDAVADRAERCSGMVVPYRNGRSRARRERFDSGLSYGQWINHPQYGSSG